MSKCYARMRIWYFLLGILYLVGTIHSKNEKDSIKICQLKIIININNRYATTVYTTKVTNTAKTKQEYTYFAAIPNNAFLTGFVINLDGKNYTSNIVDNQKARDQFESLVSSKSETKKVVRDTQAFSFSISLNSNSHASFYLTYEERLARKHGYYHEVIHIHPGYLVDDLYVEATIKESSKISNVEVPYLNFGNEMKNDNDKLESHAFVSVDHEGGVVKSQTILMKLNKTVQMQIARDKKKDENAGFDGQFNIKYDVGSDKQFGEIITGNGYFLTFFTPKGLDPIAKHIVFVLDASGSMQGNRITKLKEAMTKMLNQIHKNDLISLVEFNTQVKVWNLINSEKSVTYSRKNKLEKTNFPNPLQATSDNIKKAINSVKKFKAKGGTDILSALKVGLRLVELGRKIDKVDRKPLIMFLTDGEATVGEQSHARIKAEVSKYNSGSRKSTISTISFGGETDQKFVHSLALLNKGSFKHIYDAKDSDIQIQYFFNTTSSPVLTDINFKYDQSDFINLSDTKFPLYYDGSELIVTGQYDKKKSFKPPKIEARGTKGPLKQEVLEVHDSKDDISHLWASVTVRQLLDKININANNKAENYKKEVLNVGLKYSFVTPYSSMVFVKPEGKFVLGTKELFGQCKCG